MASNHKRSGNPALRNQGKNRDKGYKKGKRRGNATKAVITAFFLFLSIVLLAALNS